MHIQAFLLWLQATLHSWDALRPNEDSQTSETGQGLVEYALILVFVGVVVMALLIVLGPTISNMYQNIIETVQNSQNN